MYLFHVKPIGHNVESIKAFGLQSGVGSDQPRLQLVLWCQAVKAFIYRGAQFERDTLWNIQPVQFIMEDVRQTPIELPCSSNDSSGGVQDVLQLVSHSSRRIREQCIAIIYPTGHECVD